jgi:hypothetical protein
VVGYPLLKIERTSYHRESSKVVKRSKYWRTLSSALYGRTYLLSLNNQLGGLAF